MDADALYHVKELFYQASYKACIAEASSQSLSPSDPDATLRAAYIARSHLALSPPAITEAQKVLAPHVSADANGAKAVDALARYLNGDKEAVEAVRDLALEYEDEGAATSEDDEKTKEEGLVRVAAGTIFIREGENEEAVMVLTEGAAKRDLECMALLVQLLLSLDRRDLAQTTYQTAKKIGNDSRLVQAIEAWIGLKTGSRPLHQSYYYYDELYHLPSGRTPPVMSAHAAAHLMLTHVDEAKADVSQAAEAAAEDADVLAVGASLGVEGYAAKLASVAPAHPFAADLKAKSAAFDEAAAKFAIAA